MGVIDPDGREVIWDPKAGRPVEVGTARWAEIREEQVRSHIAGLLQKTRAEAVTPIETGKALRDGEGLADTFEDIKEELEDQGK